MLPVVVAGQADKGASCIGMDVAGKRNGRKTGQNSSGEPIPPIGSRYHRPFVPPQRPVGKLLQHGIDKPLVISCGSGTALLDEI